MDTLPMPLDALSATHGGLDEFRITSPSEISAMLRKLQDGNVILNLNSPNGVPVTALIWSVDSARGVISFSADLHDPHLQALVDGDEAVVVGYLDSVKLQFDVNQLVMVRSAAGTAVSGSFPRQMFRFQRRNSFRVRPLLRSAPLARLRHPAKLEMQVALRVLDVSLGGCALLLPGDLPPLAPGALMSGVQIDLDADTHFTTALRVQHVAVMNTDPPGLRLGCEMINPSRDAERALQFYIDQTQKRRRMLSLD